MSTKKYWGKRGKLKCNSFQLSLSELLTWNIESSTDSTQPVLHMRNFTPIKKLFTLTPEFRNFQCQWKHLQWNSTEMFLFRLNRHVSPFGHLPVRWPSKIHNFLRRGLGFRRRFGRGERKNVGTDNCACSAEEQGKEDGEGWATYWHSGLGEDYLISFIFMSFMTDVK